MAAAPSKRRAGSSSSYSGGGGVSLWLFLWGAGLAATVAVMAAVMTVPLKPEVELAAGKPFAPPVALEEMTDYHLRLMPFPDLFRLFHTLPAPSEPLEGEYLAEMLDNCNVLANVLAWASFSPLYPGRWVGKAFVGGGEEASYGYNSFVWFGSKINRRFRMATSVAASAWDGKPSFELQYGGQNHVLGRALMRDEVREVKPGLYLGMGTFGWTEAKRREPLPFVMRGPFGPPQPELVSEDLFQ